MSRGAYPREGKKKKFSGLPVIRRLSQEARLYRKEFGNPLVMSVVVHRDMRVVLLILLDS